jgi:hypothetical protein
MAIDPNVERRIRNLIPDTDAIYGVDGGEYLFDAQSIEDFYEDGFENIKCAAGLAKMAVGGSEALILKVIKNYETTTNGATLMKEWVAAGEKLYDMGLNELADSDANEGIFEIVYPDFGPTRHPEGMSHGSYRMGGWL